jgi:hypothetical protein
MSDDELIRYCIGLDTLTVLENELLRRFESMVDELEEQEHGGRTGRTGAG